MTVGVVLAHARVGLDITVIDRGDGDPAFDHKIRFFETLFYITLPDFHVIGYVSALLVIKKPRVRFIRVHVRVENDLFRFKSNFRV